MAIDIGGIFNLFVFQYSGPLIGRLPIIDYIKLSIKRTAMKHLEPDL